MKCKKQKRLYKELNLCYNIWTWIPEMQDRQLKII